MYPTRVLQISVNGCHAPVHDDAVSGLSGDVWTVLNHVRYRVSTLGGTASILVVAGPRSEHIATSLSKLQSFPSCVSDASLLTHRDMGIFYLENAKDLNSLPAQSFDVLLVFDWTAATPKAGDLFSFHSNRVLRSNGFLAGTGIFLNHSSSDVDHLHGISVQLSLSSFQKVAEDCGFSFQVAVDLSLEAPVELQAVEQNAIHTTRTTAAATTTTTTTTTGSSGKTTKLGSPFWNTKVREGTLVVAKFFALKTSSTKASLNRNIDTSLPASNTAAPFPVAQESTPGSGSGSGTLDTRVVVSGVSLGLPNELHPDKSFFDPSNFQRVFDGVNCISQLTDADKQDILDKNIVQVLKVEGKRVSRPLTKPSEVIQLASKLGNFDLAREYGVPGFVIQSLDTTYQLAIAAGLEALFQAGIISREWDKDSTDNGTKPPCFALPEHMQANTGVIFASSFPCLDSCVQEVTSTVDSHVRSLLKDKDNTSGHTYDRKLLFKLLVMANNQLAELIKARGPNTHMNTACSSMTQAIAMAEDWIRLGRCDRVVVISADNATSPALLSYLGTGFLALTAATTAGTVETAATPFGKDRSGMILGMGAAGMVLEKSTVCVARGGEPRAEIMASTFLNSAFHASLLDRVHISSEFSRFVEVLEQRTNMDRHKLAADSLYFSHETFTCAKGGCAKAELDALAAGLGETSKSKLIICNTKGFTGHPMGVGIEDVVAVESLYRGQIPPIANFNGVDPMFGDMFMSPGGTHNRNFALRFAAGFGSQFVYILYRKWDPQDRCDVESVPEAEELAPKSKLSCAVDDSDEEVTPQKHRYKGAHSMFEGSVLSAGGSGSGRSRRGQMDMDIDDACSIM